MGEVAGLSADDLPAELRSSLDVPSAARVYDWFLGGAHNWRVDREFGQRVVELLPEVKAYCRENRRFLNRAVRHALDRGVRQFVDIGSGLPTAGNVHEVVDEQRPDLRATVAYVDHEPVAHSFCDLLLQREGTAGRHRALRADLLDDPDGLWQQLLELGAVDPDEPVCLLIVSVLHFAKDHDEPHAAVAALRERLPAGSLLALSHWTTSDVDEAGAEVNRRLVEYYERTSNPGQLRSREEIRAFFGDFALEEPGLVYTPSWRPDGTEEFADDPARSRILAAVGRKDH